MKSLASTNSLKIVVGSKRKQRGEFYVYNWSVDGARQLSLNAAYQNGSDFRARFVNDSQRQSITPITLLFQSI